MIYWNINLKGGALIYFCEIKELYNVCDFRLEDLLTTYPPEDVEAKRWQKIATALGNRTPQQV